MESPATTGRLARRARAINAVWRFEGLGVLLWALDRYVLPAYDQLVLPDELFRAASICDNEGALEIIASARLRCLAELTAYQTHALMVNWRLTEFDLAAHRLILSRFRRIAGSAALTSRRSEFSTTI